MTLKELLNRCDFKDVAPHIVKIYPEHKYMLPDYKMAFDILRNMKPELNPNNPDKVIEIYSNKYDTSVSNCEGDFWESSLAKKIIMSGQKKSKNEIAARCLWHITFYGFSPSERDAIIDSLGKIEERFPSRTTKIEKAIRALTSNTCTVHEVKSFTREELLYLFDTNQMFEYRYQSYSFDADLRIDYLIDLISNYENADFSEFTQFLLMFRTSSDYPLAQRELERLENFFNQYLPASANIRYGYGNDETLGMEVSLLFVGSY